MNKIRSKQVIGRFVFEEWGERESFVWNSSRNLVQEGHETEVLTTKTLSDISDETVDEVPIKRFSYFYPYLNLSDEIRKIFDKQNGDPYSYQLYRYLLKCSEIDILHSHSNQRIINTVGLAAAKKEIPHVVTLNSGKLCDSEKKNTDMINPFEGSLNYGKIIDTILKNDKFLDRADGIICSNYNEYVSLREKYPHKLVEYLANGVDLEQFKIISKNNFRARYNITAEADLILCAGNIEPQKNQIKLVELLNLLNSKRKNTHLLLIGAISSESYLQIIQNRIREMKLEDSITIIPELGAPSSELVEAYNAADCLVIPSIQEPFGTAVLEAWASRLPVITHRVGRLKELITEEHTGLFFQNNSLEDLAAQYYLLRDRPGLRVKLIHNAYDEVSENYSSKVITQKLLKFYQEVIKKYQTKKKQS